MSDAAEQRKQGMQWVSDTIRSLAAEMKVELTGFDWEVGSEDFTRNQTSLLLQVGDRRVVEKFSDWDLMDIPGDNRFLSKIGKRLKNIVKKLNPPGKKIVF